MLQVVRPTFGKSCTQPKGLWENTAFRCENHPHKHIPSMCSYQLIKSLKPIWERKRNKQLSMQFRLHFIGLKSFFMAWLPHPHLRTGRGGEHGGSCGLGCKIVYTNIYFAFVCIGMTTFGHYSDFIWHFFIWFDFSKRNHIAVLQFSEWNSCKDNYSGLDLFNFIFRFFCKRENFEFDSHVNWVNMMLCLALKPKLFIFHIFVLESRIFHNYGGH